MNSEIQDLKNMIKEHEETRKKKTRRKRSSGKTNELTNEIIKDMRSRGFYAARINVSGFYRKDIGKHIPSGSTKGVSDIIGCYNGHFIGIEIKREKDKQREDQAKQQALIEQAGGSYYIVKTFQDYKDMTYIYDNTR